MTLKQFKDFAGKTFWTFTDTLNVTQFSNLKLNRHRVLV